MRGKCIWFNPARGYGFVADQETDKEYFAHFSMIQASGYRQLKPEQRVEFEVENGGPKNKPQAINIRILS